MKHPSLSVVIPAAGSSVRLGQPKQLVEHNGMPLICKAVENALSLSPAEVIVVTGAYTDAVEAATRHSAARCVYHSNWAQGMGGSIAAGVAAINPDSAGLLILLCDQWRVQTTDLQTLAKTWQSDPTRIIAATTEGSLMPPAIFPARCFDELQQLGGDHGARSVINAHARLVTAVPVSNAAFDLDTKTQLEALQKPK